MLEDSFTSTSHLSVAMTTEDDGDVPTTAEAGVPLSSSRGTAINFQCAVVIVGVVGAAANSLIIYAMIASKQHKKKLLIFNQNVSDLCSCLLLIITYALKLCNIRLIGTLGYWLCMVLLSENLLWCSVDASVINLMSISVERYLKVVRPAWGKKLLRNWVIYSTVAFAWIGSVIYNMILSYSTSGIIDGVCYPTIIWKSQAVAVIYTIWYFVSFIVLVAFINVFCYGRILVVIRRQAKVMARHSGPGSSTTQTQSHHIQSNLIQTMILVSAFYIISWTPTKLYYVLFTTVGPNFTHIESAYNATTIVAFLYICANPFIYATKFNPVKRILVGLIPCKRSQPAGENVEMRVTRNVPTR